MPETIIAGNWKMYGRQPSIDALTAAIAAIESSATVIVFPPLVYLAQVRQALQHTHIQWGAQNIAAAFEDGAYTGEVSGAMLADLGCRYVLVGHSERRQLFSENNTTIATKFISAQAAGLIPILCVGETQEERQAGMTKDIVMGQLQAVIDMAGIEAFKQAIIAYEPVWAIGTGLTASPEQAQVVHSQIREHFATIDGTIASVLTLLYGGSVKPGNAAQLFAMPDINGGLIGGASLDADSFKQICQAV